MFLSQRRMPVSYTHLGKTVGTITNSKDIPVMMGTALKQNIMLIVIALTASIFIKLFNLSNLPTIVGFKGAELINSANLTGYPTLVIIVCLTAFFNLFIGSANAKWLMLAPIYIPMFTAVGFSPAMVTAAYRCGDSCTNPIAPLSTMLVVAIALFERFNEMCIRDRYWSAAASFVRGGKNTKKVKAPVAKLPHFHYHYIALCNFIPCIGNLIYFGGCHEGRFSTFGRTRL